ncbi:hypothetical protein CYMTET_31968, partial [Cymbomonas tetramitiformis]
VLRYYAYFQEQLGERHQERSRIRRCVLHFFLEDGSIQVTEPREENSGIVQGVFLKRMRVPRDPPRGRSKYLEMEDLHVGGKVRMFSRNYHIVGCDNFTRAFLQREGHDVPPDQSYPDDGDRGQIYMQRKQPEYALRIKPKGGASHKTVAETEKIRKFIENDRKVLRFFAVWDTRKEDPLDGERRAFVLNYYLSDDEIEILEVCERNSGRDPFPKLLSKSKLPKQVYGVGARPMSDLTRKRMNHQFYILRDLRIGEVVMVYNRQLLLHDCDEYTRDFYMQEFGYTPQDFSPVPLGDVVPAARKQEVPPHNLFGKEEDSELNCHKLVPRQKQSNPLHFQEHDGKVLRFTCRMEDTPQYPCRSPIDASRQFVLTYHIVDDGIGIFEPKQRNSGIEGGKFLERVRVRKPGSNNYYSPKDMYMGAMVVVHCKAFRLLDADHHSLRYMSMNPQSFPRSDPAQVIPHLQDAIRRVPDGNSIMRQELIEADPRGTGFVTTPTLEVVFSRMGCHVEPQEMITIGQYLDPDMGAETINIENLIDCLQI